MAKPTSTMNTKPISSGPATEVPSPEDSAPVGTVEPAVRSVVVEPPAGLDDGGTPPIGSDPPGTTATPTTELSGNVTGASAATACWSRTCTDDSVATASR